MPFFSPGAEATAVHPQGWMGSGTGRVLSHWPCPRSQHNPYLTAFEHKGFWMLRVCRVQGLVQGFRVSEEFVLKTGALGALAISN